MFGNSESCEASKIEETYATLIRGHARNTDRLFVFLLIFQYVGAVTVAFVVAPFAWSGVVSRVHEHVYAAVLGGGLLTIFPVYMNWRFPGETINMTVNAVAQALYSILLIHLTGGRIETHFHVFVSLAFLFSYRDARPLLIMSAITVIDHAVRGAFWPVSVYGVMSISNLRTLEHGGWVIFEDVILFYLLSVSRRELMEISRSQCELVEANSRLVAATTELGRVNLILKKEVVTGAGKLLESQKLLKQQKDSLVASSKMSALGEMAGGIAHEINNPLGVIHGKVGLLLKMLEMNKAPAETVRAELNKILAMSDRIAKIVLGLKFFSRKQDGEDMKDVRLVEIIDNTLSLCSDRFRSHQVKLEIEPTPDVFLHCRSVQIEQVLINLLNNAYDAVDGLSEKWVKVSFQFDGGLLKIDVTDSGPGIPPEIASKMMELFYTTKAEGKGTGLGLSISREIMEAHKGTLRYDSSSPHTRFSIEVPLGNAQIGSREAA